MQKKETEIESQNLAKEFVEYLKANPTALNNMTPTKEDIEALCYLIDCNSGVYLYLPSNIKDIEIVGCTYFAASFSELGEF